MHTSTCAIIRGLHFGKYIKLYYSTDLLAHLSRRLTGELIGYPWIRRPSSSVHRRPFTFSNIFSSETAWPIKAKFYVEPPWEGGTKISGDQVSEEKLFENVNGRRRTDDDGRRIHGYP